jgi:hypothetical protein
LVLASKANITGKASGRLSVFNQLILLSNSAYPVASSHQDALNEIALTLATPPVKAGLYHF